LSAGDRPGFSVDLPDVATTGEFGGHLAAALPADTAGWMILLEGDLGSGKSTLARALLRGLGFEGTVPSPTYTLVEPYDVQGRTVYHIDLYRISGERDLPFLGWEDLRDGLMLIEWPERVPALRGHADLLISIDFAGDGRKARLTAITERAARLTKAEGIRGMGLVES